jgi:hypothetical protein
MLLVCSDIHLLMGFGIQVTGLMKKGECEMSVYHWRVIADLGFLSSVTGLLAVMGLRDNFVQKRWSNTPRVVGVLGNLALCGYTSWVAYSYDRPSLDLNMSISCLNGAPLNAALVGRWAALMIAAIGAHGSVVLAMYVLDEPKEEERKRWWAWNIGAVFRTWVVAPVYSIYGIYMAGVGLRHTQALGTPNLRNKGSEREWGFGQLLPILLLALPLLAGWEAFWEEKGEVRKDRSSKKDRRVEKGMIGSPIPKTSQHSSTETSEEGSSVESTSPIYTPYSLSPDMSEEEKRTESNGSSPEIPKTYHLSAFKDPHETYNGRPGTIVEEEAHTREPPAPRRQRSTTSRRSMHFSYPNRALPRSSQARLSQARLSQFQNDSQPILCDHCESLPRESLYVATDPHRRSRRSSHRRSQAVRASYVPL